MRTLSTRVSCVYIVIVDLSLDGKKNVYSRSSPTFWTGVSHLVYESGMANKGFNRTPVSSAAAKPAEFDGGAG